MIKNIKILSVDAMHLNHLNIAVVKATIATPNIFDTAELCIEVLGFNKTNLIMDWSNFRFELNAEDGAKVEAFIKAQKADLSITGFSDECVNMAQKNSYRCAPSRWCNEKFAAFPDTPSREEKSDQELFDQQDFCEFVLPEKIFQKPVFLLPTRGAFNETINVVDHVQAVVDIIPKKLNYINPYNHIDFAKRIVRIAKSDWHVIAEHIAREMNLRTVSQSIIFYGEDSNPYTTSDHHDAFVEQFEPEFLMSLSDRMKYEGLFYELSQSKDGKYSITAYYMKLGTDWHVRVDGDELLTHLNELGLKNHE